MRLMKIPVRQRVIALLVASLLSQAALAAATESAPPAAAIDPRAAPVPPELGSYHVGLMLGSQLEHNGLAPLLSSEQLIKGLRDGLGGRQLTAEERELALRFMRDARGNLARKNQAAALEFLEKNGKQPGILTMPSGLQYRILAAGEPTGKSPSPTDQVTVRYKASLADGTEFDRSESHERPATFRVNTVFKGWQEAFQSMKPGAKWQLFVPPELGYGANSPPQVPPGALLVYELELLSVDSTPPVDANGVKIGTAPKAPSKAAPAVTPH